MHIYGIYGAKYEHCPKMTQLSRPGLSFVCEVMRFSTAQCSSNIPWRRLPKLRASRQFSSQPISLPEPVANRVPMVQLRSTRHGPETEFVAEKGRCLDVHQCTGGWRVPHFLMVWGPVVVDARCWNSCWGDEELVQPFGCHGDLPDFSLPSN